jgi:hypothetical protein
LVWTIQHGASKIQLLHRRPHLPDHGRQRRLPVARSAFFARSHRHSLEERSHEIVNHHHIAGGRRRRLCLGLRRDSFRVCARPRVVGRGGLRLRHQLRRRGRLWAPRARWPPSWLRSHGREAPRCRVVRGWHARLRLERGLGLRNGHRHSDHEGPRTLLRRTRRETSPSSPPKATMRSMFSTSGRSRRCLTYRSLGSRGSSLSPRREIPPF